MASVSRFLTQKLRLKVRRRPPGGAGLPNAQQPDPVEALLREAVERRAIDIGERDAFSGLAGEAVKPNPHIDLKQRRITRHGRCGHLCRFDLSAEDCLLTTLQKSLGIELAEDFDQGGDDPGPSGLMASANASAVVAMEVFVE
jgi:hypothetical protein